MPGRGASSTPASRETGRAVLCSLDRSFHVSAKLRLSGGGVGGGGGLHYFHNRKNHFVQLSDTTLADCVFGVSVDHAAINRCVRIEMWSCSPI
jgi:hypothetical protein